MHSKEFWDQPRTSKVNPLSHLPTPLPLPCSQYPFPHGQENVLFPVFLSFLYFPFFLSRVQLGLLTRMPWALILVLSESFACSANIPYRWEIAYDKVLLQGEGWVSNKRIKSWTKHLPRQVESSHTGSRQCLLLSVVHFKIVKKMSTTTITWQGFHN